MLRLPKICIGSRHIADKLLVNQPIIYGLIFWFYLRYSNQQFFENNGQLLARYKPRFSCYQQMTTGASQTIINLPGIFPEILI